MKRTPANKVLAQLAADRAPLDVLAVMDRMRGVMNGDASQDANVVYQESLEARASVAELVDAVRTVDAVALKTGNAELDRSITNLRAALAKFGGAA